MCGILGQVTINGKSVCRNNFEHALDMMKHRGPDDEGIYSFNFSDIDVCLGQRRLSILDLSQEGHQPMISPRTGNVIVYNGEVYNFKEVRAELINKGYSFKSNCDTEVILAAYEEWASKCVDHFNGMFAFAIWDNIKKQLFVVRDRIGIKPLFYSWDGSSFVFSSELLSFSVLGISVNISKEGLYHFLTHHQVPFPLTMLDNVFKIDPGCYIVFDINNKNVVKTQYWNALDFYDKKLTFNNEEDLLENIEQRIISSVKYRLISDVPLGIFLSGGIDSCLLTAVMVKYSTGKVKTFSIGFEEQEYDEAPAARRVAEYFGTEHKELYMTDEDIRKHAMKVAYLFDEPLGEVALIPTYALSEMARRDVTVALSGDGGDELFWGYPKYNPSFLTGAIYKYVPYIFRKAISNVLVKNNSVNLQTRGYLLGLKNFEEFHLSRKDWVRELAYSNLISFESPDDIIESMWNKVLERFSKSDWVANTSALDVIELLPNQFLPKIDKASMLNSLEVRVPLLDYNLVEFVAQIPSKYKTKGGQQKYILRTLLERYLPKNLWDRPKQGFHVPIENWIRTHLKDWVYSEILEGSQPIHDWLNKKALESIWNDHIKCKRNNGILIWSCLILSIWYNRILGFRKVQ